MSTRYIVAFESYAERYYIKRFKKKYSERVWGFTENAIRSLCVNFDELLQTEQCEVISHAEHKRLCKLQFAVAGTGKSPKKSGNRCIVVADVAEHRVDILLVYHKSDIVKQGNETVAWKQIIKRKFGETKARVFGL